MYYLNHYKTLIVYVNLRFINFDLLNKGLDDLENPALKNELFLLYSFIIGFIIDKASPLYSLISFLSYLWLRVIKTTKTFV